MAHPPGGEEADHADAESRADEGGGDVVAVLACFHQCHGGRAADDRDNGWPRRADDRCHAAHFGRHVQARVRLAEGIGGALHGVDDGTRDTGCGFKCFRREVYLALPYFDALHRFMPALVRREGFEIAYVDVKDRPRLSGVSNYGFFDRLWVGIVDLMGVRWLIRRRRRTPRSRE